jgi:transposase-like protein
MSQHKLTKEQRARLIARAEDGEKRIALAAEYGISECTIYKLLKRSGITIARPASAPHQDSRQIDWGKIAELNERGLWQAAIARELGCTTSAVVYALEQLGLKPNYKHAWRAERFGGVTP